MLIDECLISARLSGQDESHDSVSTATPLEQTGPHSSVVAGSGAKRGTLTGSCALKTICGGEAHG